MSQSRFSRPVLRRRAELFHSIPFRRTATVRRKPKPKKHLTCHGRSYSERSLLSATRRLRPNDCYAGPMVWKMESCRSTADAPHPISCSLFLSPLPFFPHIIRKSQELVGLPFGGEWRVKAGGRGEGVDVALRQFVVGVHKFSGGALSSSR